MVSDEDADDYLVIRCFTINFGQVNSCTHSYNVGSQPSPGLVVELIEQTQRFLNAASKNQVYTLEIKLNLTLNLMKF